MTSSVSESKLTYFSHLASSYQLFIDIPIPQLHESAQDSIESLGREHSSMWFG
jgi:hypothetical protein